MPLDPQPAASTITVNPAGPLLQPSPFQPRKAMDHGALQDLAASIKAQGVLQPIVARKLGDGLEIIFGHRRHAAAQLAGVDQVPVIVREMSDAEVQAAQLIENLQREGLNPMEEAEGYARLANEHKLTLDQIAERVGKKRGVVHLRLSLLKLQQPVCAALANGTIDSSVAALIARVHPKLQERALKRAMDRGPDGGTKSYRTIRDDLVETFTLKLSDAIFDRNSPDLLPNAGACTTCAKRSGNDPDLFADVVSGDTRYGFTRGKRGEQICMDEVCFEEKKKAHLKREADKLAAKGKQLVTGGAARAAVSAHGEVKGAYVALKDVKAELEKVKKKAPDKVPEIITIQDPRNGKLVQAVKREDAKAAGVKLESTERDGPDRSYQAIHRKQEEERERAEAKAHRESLIRRELLKAVRAKYSASERSAFDLQLVVQHAIDTVGWDARAALCWIRDWKNLDEGKRTLAKLSRDDLAVLLLDIALAQDLHVSTWRSERATRLEATAQAYGVDAAQVRKAWEAANVEAAAQGDGRAAKKAKGK
jgi:ParB/RepB/Spo0J family partition protein